MKFTCIRLTQEKDLKGKVLSETAYLVPSDKAVLVPDTYWPETTRVQHPGGYQLTDHPTTVTIKTNDTAMFGKYQEHKTYTIEV